MTGLVGREPLVREVRSELAAGHSVLLYGPEAIGKSAIVAATATQGVTIVDPFERVTRQRAAQIRRALDRGAVYLGAARVSHGRDLGAVGRILWRFRLLRVRELPTTVLIRILASELTGGVELTADGDPAWAHQAAQLAAGRPGFAVAMAQFARVWRHEYGYLPLPGMAFAASREEAVIRALSHHVPGAQRRQI